MSANITISGNLAADPELRFTKDGKAVVRFTVMTSRSKKNDEGKWESFDVTGWPVTAWDKLAENVAESLLKGDPVIVTGTAATKSWEDKDGNPRSRIEVNAWEVAIGLKRFAVSPRRTERVASTTASTNDDPWATPAKDDIPPF